MLSNRKKVLKKRHRDLPLTKFQEIFKPRPFAENIYSQKNGQKAPFAHGAATQDTIRWSEITCINARSVKNKLHLPREHFCIIRICP